MGGLPLGHRKIDPSDSFVPHDFAARKGRVCLKVDAFPVVNLVFQSP